ncbi:hypothetical protein GGI07_004491 [Coemansia sp. Benny D115]|nr:hypothetical protein GGI07_004491 [Coemansia sp. Benny D115]
MSLSLALCKDLASSVLQLLTPLNLGVGVTAFVGYRVLYALYLSPLRNVPGSFWARVSTLPTFYHDMRGTELDYMRDQARKYGSLFVMEPHKVAVCDPDDCQVILGSHAFMKDHMYANVDIMEPNTFLTRDPELNRQRRRQVGPALGLPKLKQMEPGILAAGTEQLWTKWDRAVEDAGAGGARVKYHEDFLLMTFDIISSLGFGRAHRSLTSGDRQIVTWVKRTFTVIFLQMLLPIVKAPLMRRLLSRPLYSEVERFLSLGRQAIADRRELLREQATEKPHDLLQAFMDAQDPDSRVQMTEGQVAAETIVGLLAGSETSANTLCWTLHLLLMHPEHLQRVIAEIRQKFGPDHCINYAEARAQLPFLEACILESLRLMPVAGNLPRQIPRGGVVLQGHFIPEGHTCSVSIAAANVCPKVWGDRAEVFDPQRFLNRSGDELRRRLLTFSAGVRACPGKNLAWVQIMPTLANVLSRYDVQVPEDAMFQPDQKDERGRPLLMPYAVAITCVPRFPDRDCVAVITKRKE